MRRIRGFQQPDSKGKDMLRSEKGPWELYQRGPSYRIGRKFWWGIKWFKDHGTRGTIFAFHTDSLAHAQAKLKRMNEEAYDKNWYKADKWEVKK